MSPEETRRVLADFEAWLGDAARAGDAPPPAAPFDVAGVLGQFVALRQEVNLQTRAVRAQQEQAAAALDAVARQRGPDPADAARPLLLALVEAHDALALAGREVARQREAVLAELEATPPPPGFWARLFGAAPPRPPEAGKLRGVLDGLVKGYEMGLARLERALARHGVEPVEAVGRPFDPERMEALEPVDAPGRPRGEVAEEVRRGWAWQGRVLRFAQVRVAR